MKLKWKHNDQKTFRQIAVCFVFFLLFLIPSGTGAVETIIEAAAGFNDNVQMTPDGDSSAFAAYRLTLSGQLPLKNPETISGGFVDLFYQDYFDASDNFQLSAGWQASKPLPARQFRAELFLNGTLYRDRENIEDEMNEGNIGGTLYWYASKRIDVRCGLTFGIRDYPNQADYETVFRTLPGDGHGSGSGSQTVDTVAVYRDDHFISGLLGLTVKLTPDIEIEGNVFHDRVSSSLDTESYYLNGCNLSFSQPLFQKLDLAVLGGYSRTYFENVANLPKRSDTTWTASMGLSVPFSRFDLFALGEYVDNQSSVEIETYIQRQIQCGITLYF